MKLTKPYGMLLTDWADQICLDLESYGVVSKLLDELDWQNWAVQFLNNGRLGRNLPNPYNFDEWKEWAERFCGTLS